MKVKMKSSLKILAVPIITFLLLLNTPMKGECQNGYNVPLGGGVAAEFTPDAIGTYHLNYYATGFYNWDLVVRVYWQSDTYPGWHEFYVRTYHNVNYASDSVILYSGTDDNVRYRVEFWTNSATAIGTWVFS